MDALKIYHDPEARTLTVWFDEPTNEHSAEETGDEVVLIKDQEGHVIGFERLNDTPHGGHVRVDVAEAPAP